MPIPTEGGSLDVSLLSLSLSLSLVDRSLIAGGALSCRCRCHTATPPTTTSGATSCPEYLLVARGTKSTACCWVSIQYPGLSFFFFLLPPIGRHQTGRALF
jgi:hypothetical protein